MSVQNKVIVIFLLALAARIFLGGDIEFTQPVFQHGEQLQQSENN